MARLPRLVLPGNPYHVTQRGNRRQTVFFGDDDYALYRDLLGEAARTAGAEVWAYCLMPNHVHIIIVPHHEDGLRATFGEAHRRYTRHINARHKWTGHLWQGRFGAAVMDEAHLAAAVRYVAMNPVKAGLVRQAQDWPWSSVAAHLAGEDDTLVQVAPVLDRYGDFAAFLGKDTPLDTDRWAAVQRAETTGRPVGSKEWLTMLEAQTGLMLHPKKRGPKPTPKDVG